MSRLAKVPVILPANVVVKEERGLLFFKGPKGERSVKILPGVRVQIEDNKARVESDGAEENKAGCGTMWSLIRGAAQGVSEGFVKVLEVEGVGYKAVVEGKEVVLSLGGANPVRFPIPQGIVVTAEKDTIKISGADKELVGEVAARIRALRKPEPYKGKGIHYQGEVIRRKVGKKAAATMGAPA